MKDLHSLTNSVLLETITGNELAVIIGGTTTPPPRTGGPQPNVMATNPPPSPQPKVLALGIIIKTGSSTPIGD
jgi:hypothetical protein